MNTYRIKARRFLKKYTAANLSPDYAGLSDAVTASEAIREIPWEECPVDVEAALPAHDGEAREANAANRDRFDAAAWCGEHADGMHRAYAQAACYRIAFPDAAVGGRIASVSVRVTCDPYCAQGAHVALAAGGAGDVPPSWTDATRGLLRASRAAMRSFSTAEDGTILWRAETGDVVFSPAGGIETPKFLFVFVTLEDYAFARNGHLEGSAMLGPAVSVSTEDPVPGWSADSTVDASDEGREFAVCRGGVLPGLREADRAVRSYECLASGGELPEAKLWVKQVTASTSALYFGGVKIRDIPADSRGVRIFASQVIPRTQNGVTVANGYAYADWHWADVQYYAVLGIGSATATGSVGAAGINQISPGAAFFIRWRPVPGRTAFTDTNYRLTEITNLYDFLAHVATPDEENVEAAFAAYAGYLGTNQAYAMLANGTASSIVLVATYGSSQMSATFSSSWDRASSRTSYARYRPGCQVYVAGSSGIALLGCVCGSEFVPNGESGTVSSANALHALCRMNEIVFHNSWVELAEQGTEDGAGYRLYRFTAAFADSVAKTIIPVSVSGNRVVVGSVGSVEFDGEVLGVTAYPYSITTSFVVYGRFTRFDGRDCRVMAVLTVRGGSVSTWIPATERMLEPDTYEQFQISPSWETASPTVLVTGVFTRLGQQAARGSALFNLKTGTYANALQSLSDEPGFIASLQTAAPDSAGLTTTVYSAGATLGTAAKKSRMFYVTGNHLRSFRARSGDDLSVPSPTEEESAAGLRNAYAKVYGGRCEDVPFAGSEQPGASFSVRLADASVPSTPNGVDEETTNVSMWRITASAALVPFSAPTLFRARRIRFDWGGWTGTATAGSRFAAWLRRGEFVEAMPSETLRSPRILDASVREVDGWELVGTIDAASPERSATFTVAPLDCDRATLLLTAWCPQDGFSPSAGMELPRGAGNILADAVNGTVSGLATGWRPDITLLG